MKLDIEDIRKRMDEIPFGNSYFQNVTFHTKETKERQYRHCLLQIDAKLTALQESYFRRKEIELDIEELEAEINHVDVIKGSIKERRIQIEIDRKKYQLDKELKLIKDAEIEVMTHYNFVKEMPIITREQFESSEKLYWNERLTGDADIENLLIGTVEKGTALSLKQMGIDVYRDEFNRIQLDMTKQLEDKL